MPANEEHVALFFACVNENRVDALRTWFAKNDIDIDIKTSLMFRKYNGPIKSYCGKTAFGIAAKSGRVAMMQTLLELGAFIAAPDGNGDYIIHNALTADLIDVETIEAIVEKLKTIPLAQRTQLNTHGASALSCSVRLPDPEKKLRAEITKLLLEAGIDPNEGEGYNLPLIAAMSLKHENRNHEIVKILLDGEADEMGDNGNSLKIAASEGYIEAAQIIMGAAEQSGTLSTLLEDTDEIIAEACESGEIEFAQWFNGLRAASFSGDLSVSEDAVVPSSEQACAAQACAAAANDDVETMGSDSDEG